MKFWLAIAAALSISGQAEAAEIRVLSTQATEPAYRALIPEFERMTGNSVKTLFTGTLDADRRLKAGEAYDLLIMSSLSIDEEIKDGRVLPGSRVDIAKSGVAVGVKAGASRPDIHNTEALRKTLLHAKSIGYSTGPSGNIIVALFEKLGVLDAVRPKMKQTPSGVFVGTIIASGDVEIGFQQASELSHFEGVDFVGLLPADIQTYTTFSSGVTQTSKVPEAARALVKFLTSPEAQAVFRLNGMEPGS